MGIQPPLTVTSPAFGGTGPGGARTIDHYDLDDGDASHPIYVDYRTPAGMISMVKATISWKLRAFRSTVNLSPSSVGSDASGESGHSHSHNHTMSFSGGLASNTNLMIESTNGAAPLGTPNTAFNDSQTIQTNAQGSSGHSHSHTHSLTGSAQQQVTEGASNNVTALSIDGHDYTAALGGPWTGDVVDLDLTSDIAGYLSTNQWHTITLTLAGLGRLASVLRFYYSQ
jgi:hypothetical protein